MGTLRAIFPIRGHGSWLEIPMKLELSRSRTRRRHIEQEEQRAQRLEEGFANVGLDDGDGNEEDQAG